jgi:hypothetical protein
MSYKTVYGYQTVNAGGSYPYTKDAAIKIKDTMVAMGWSLIYDGSADTPPKYVLKSTGGESGTKMDAYVAVQWSYSTYANRIIFRPYVYWNTTNNTGYADSYNAPLCITTWDSSTFYLWVYGNLDGVFCVVKSGSTYHMGGAAYGKAWYTKGAALTANSPSGTYPLSNAEISVSDASQFIAGKQYQIVGAFDNAGTTQGSRETVTVSNVNTGSNIITISSLPKKYLSGARIGQTPYTFIAFHDYSGGFHGLCPALWTTTGTGSDTTYSTTYWVGISTAADESPNPRAESLWSLTPCGYIDTSSPGGILLYVDFFYLTATTINQEDTFEIGRQDTGTSTSTKTTADNTLDDSSKEWTTTFPDPYDALVGKFIIITGGTGAGQTRKIISYTDTQLTLNSNWSSNIGVDTTYVLCDEAYRGFKSSSGYVFAFAIKEVL